MSSAVALTLFQKAPIVMTLVISSMAISALIAVLIKLTESLSMKHGEVATLQPSVQRSLLPFNLGWQWPQSEDIHMVSQASMR